MRRNITNLLKKRIFFGLAALAHVLNEAFQPAVADDARWPFHDGFPQQRG
jgi:Spy/CpxP family protein refolding chaperone